jgi:hypothetical protein
MARCYQRCSSSVHFAPTPTHENHEASFMMIPMQLSSPAGKMPVAAIFGRRQLAD